MPQDLTTTLKVRENNPYSTGSVLKLEDRVYFLERKPLIYRKNAKDRYYTVIDSDTIWAIAHEAYGDSKLYWVISDVNKILLPIDINPGDTLIIPDLPSLRAIQSY